MRHTHVGVTKCHSTTQTCMSHKTTCSFMRHTHMTGYTFNYW